MEVIKNCLSKFSDKKREQKINNLKEVDSWILFHILYEL